MYIAKYGSNVDNTSKEAREKYAGRILFPANQLATCKSRTSQRDNASLLAPLGALSRRSDRDNRQPSIPSTYSSDCSKPFYCDLKQTVTDRDCS